MSSAPCAALFLALAALPAAAVPVGGSGQAVCDLLHTQCNSVANKLPEVTADLPAGSSVELGLDGDDKEAFEHLLGHGFRNSPAVAWATTEFVKRAVAVAVHGKTAQNETDAAILGSFADPKFHPGNTGYVGPDLEAIRTVLEGAGGSSNIREVWALMYAVTKNSWETPFGDTLQTIDAAGITKLGLNGPAVLARRAAIKATEGAPKSFDKYSNGLQDWSYEGFNSWTRFDFDATTLAGKPLWSKARDYACPDCCTWPAKDGQTPMMSDDASIMPPLSTAELRYQCNGTAPPCKLKWYPGKLCYKLLNATWPATGGAPGYLARAGKLGYRTVAAPSGTTANVLQYALMLGFTPDEMVLVRLALAAWMLCTDDHSLYEIMLGAAPYMPAGAQIVQDLDDLGRMFPSSLRVAVKGGQTISADSTWAAVAKEFGTARGAAVINKLGGAAKTYVQKLLKL